MADAVAAAPKRRGWLRILGWAVLAIFVLLVVLYFVVTSSGFFKSFILPRVGQAVHADITVADASISPFSSVVLTKVKVETKGSEPLLTADEIRVAYNLRDIIAGNYHVDELTIASPVIHYTKAADGTSNIDPLLQSSSTTASKPSAAKSTPPQIDIRKVSLKDASVFVSTASKDGSSSKIELSKINIDLAGFKNGQSGKVTISATAKVDNRPAAPADASGIDATAAGELNVALTQDLQPASIGGNLHLDIQQATGALADASALSALLDCDVSPTEIKKLDLSFKRGGSDLGKLRVTGPFVLAKQEGKLNVEIASIDRQVLNIVGAKSGIDFGTTQINSTNQLEITSAATVIKAAGSLGVGGLSIKRQDLTTPTVNIRADYDLTVDLNKKSASIRTFLLDGTERGKSLLHAGLTSPMSVAWGETAGDFGDSSVKLDVTGFDLSEWKSLLGEKVSAGTVNATANITAQQDGQKVQFDILTKLENLDATAGSSRINQAGLTLSAKGQALKLKDITLSELKADVTHQNQSLVSVSGSGQYNRETQKADLQLALDASIPRALQLMPQPGVTFSSGNVHWQGTVHSSTNSQGATGSLNISNLTGQLKTTKLTDFATAIQLDAVKNGDQIHLAKVSGNLSVAARAGGTFDVTGDYNTGQKSGSFTLKLADINENLLHPFLDPALGDKKLVSVLINMDSSANIAAEGATSFKTDFHLSKLVVNDPEHKIPSTPLEIRFQADIGMKDSVTDIRQCLVSLTPTARGKNALNLAGKIDLSNTNATQADLKLSAESIDLTTYYDIFTGNSKATAAAKPAPAQPAAPANTEPPAMNLPVRNSSLSVDIAQLYLRELAISNFQAVVKADGAHVTVTPCQLTLNGAPVKANADLNLGVPGYQYDVGFSADRIPLKPLMDSFSTNSTMQTKGDIIANVQVKGAGVTGASLKKSLAGMASLSFTNADIQIQYSRLAKLLITPIAFVLNLNELTASPLDYFYANLNLGSGVIDLTSLKVASSAFTAESHGQIPIADVLTNSPLNNLPVTISLSRNLAQKSGLLAANTAPDAAYASLPQFVTVGGTLGSVKVSTDKAVILGLTGRSVLNAAENIPGVIGGKAGNILGGVSDLLTGQSRSTNTTSTNSPATNKPAHVNPFDLLRKVIPK